jgi:hypothetical protein
MNRQNNRLINIILALLVLTSIFQANPRKTGKMKITVEVNKPGHKISPM